MKLKLRKIFINFITITTERYRFKNISDIQRKILTTNILRNELFKMFNTFYTQKNRNKRLI